MGADRQTGGFGGKLRAARERRGVALRQIANKTKISVSALEALERNDISRLPGGIFSRAFVRSYAVEVGLDPEETIQEFLAQFPHDASVTAGHPRSDQVEDGEALESDRRVATTFLRLIAISIALAGALLYFSSAAHRNAWRHGPAAQPPDTSGTAPAPAPAAPRTTPPAAVTTAPVVPAAAETVEPAGPVRPVIAPADRLVVDVSATRQCWVSATVDGTKVLEHLLEPGDARTLEVRRELVLTAGDAGAIAMKLNGAAARPLGKAGEVVTARLNLSNFRTFLPEQ